MEYRKFISGEAVKGVTAACAGAALFWIGQQWLTSDLEYHQQARNSYLSASLGQQGLSMAYAGKPLSNASIVDFSIYNRTSKQFNNVDLMFSIIDPKTPFTLISSGIITPSGIPQPEIIEEIPTKEPWIKNFKIKAFPKQSAGESYDAVFVFDGDKAPQMSVVSLSNDVSIGHYRDWKDAIEFVLLFGLPTIILIFTISSLIDYFTEPSRHRKLVKRFAHHAVELSEAGALRNSDPDAIADAGEIYASFARPKPSKVWSKIFPARKFDY
ncbi:hypothetical protein ABH944_007411 [Caballeronia udeis]|uniref:Uncharacterized protein n=1 Tax=Caballeronia udeis TaxID=1232866 RepID=A0ABW8MTT8_9BURK